MEVNTIMSKRPALLVVDLEATCSNDNTVPREEMETIEIGAVLCDPVSFRPIREFQTFVRPVRHWLLTPFCTELTTITQQDVAKAPLFPAAIAALTAFATENGEPLPIFCSWGAYDGKQFDQDARYHRIPPPFSEHRINLKQAFADVEGHLMGNRSALKRVGLRPDGIYHRGIDDARNIAKLLPWTVGQERLPVRNRR